MVYKAMCLIIQERLVNVVGVRQLLAEEQGGLGGERKRMSRSDSDFDTFGADYDVKKEERNASCIHLLYRKAYDRVDQSKLWDCLEGAGLKGNW